MYKQTIINSQELYYNIHHESKFILSPKSFKIQVSNI